MDEAQVAAVFTEWHRRWAADPEGFAAEQQSLAAEHATYGQRAAAMFLAIAHELAE